VASVTRSKLTGIVVGTVLTLAVAGCGAEEYTTISHDDPPQWASTTIPTKPRRWRRNLRR
jgi:hypothetical protein